MLHLPLGHPRGLLTKVRQGKDGHWMLTYAYEFPGVEKLDITITNSGRPRERMPDELFQKIRPRLMFIQEYERAYGKGTALNYKPTF